MATAAMTADAWDPAQYERFRAERDRPFFDLLALVQPLPGLRAADLGCGTGELTRALHERLGAGETVGIDSSAAMLARSQAFAGGGLRFERGDISAFAAPAAYDLIFSNAALQWLPDQAGLLALLARALAPGGQLAVQVPANYDYPTHVIADALAAEPLFRDALGDYQRGRAVLAPEQYAETLHRLGFAEQHVRLQVYTHLLPSREEVLEWVKGTLLTRYRARLDTDRYEAFLARYRQRLLLALPDERPFFYPFKRILLWARLPYPAE